MPIAEKPPPKIIKVGLVQLNNSFSGQCYFPLSVGMLQAYAQRYLNYTEYYQFLLPIYTFMKIDEVADRLAEADIVGFSVYVWNFRNSLAIARELKRRNPRIIIIFGGPHVPDSRKQFQRIKKSDPAPDDLKRQRIGMTEKFHRDNPQVDIACHGEGERIFKILLERFAFDRLFDKSDIPSISYISDDGSFHHNPKMERMRDLSQVPSPYLSGIFDPLIETNPGQAWIAMWETDRGCPYQCTYCDWGGAIEDKVSPFGMARIVDEIRWFGEHKIPYIFLANANFGILKQDVAIASSLAETKRITGYPEGISVQNAKNPRPHTLEALEILERAGLNKATVMSIQSKNPETLTAVRRENMRPEEYQGIQSRLRAKGVYTMTDYIIPMPMETYASLLNGICQIIADGQHDRIQFNNLSILPNAEMGDPEYQEAYNMEMVRTCITNIHGKKNASISGVEETQDLVVATSTMPRDEWVKARTLCYLVAFVYFNKLLQIPIIILHEVYGIAYKDIFELLMEKPKQSEDFPTFREIIGFFEAFSRGIQDGTQEEFFHSSEYLDILWPPDEYVFIRLCRENRLEFLYSEAQTILRSLISSDQANGVLADAVKINRFLVKEPFMTADYTICLSWNVWDVYRAAILGMHVPVKSGDYEYIIDRTTEKWDSWEEWYEKMVWWCNRRGAYLYGTKNPHQEISGHH